MSFDSTPMSSDMIEFLGEVAKWLKSAPSLKPGYGEFFVEKVSVSFDGIENIGHFEPDGIGEDTYQFVLNGPDND